MNLDNFFTSYQQDNTVVIIQVRDQSLFISREDPGQYGKKS